MDISSGNRTFRCSGQVGAIRSNSLPCGDLFGKSVWLSAAERYCIGMGRASTVAVSRLGLLDRPASSSSSDDDSFWPNKQSLTDACTGALPSVAPGEARRWAKNDERKL